MRAFLILVLFFVMFAVGIVVGNFIKKQKYVGSSVVVNGDTLRIVEWTHRNIYVLENGLVYRLKEK